MDDKSTYLNNAVIFGILLQYAALLILIFLLEAICGILAYFYEARVRLKNYIVLVYSLQIFSRLP